MYVLGIEGQPLSAGGENTGKDDRKIKSTVRTRKPTQHFESGFYKKVTSTGEQFYRSSGMKSLLTGFPHNFFHWV
jgi:hypothetical protein